MRQLKGLKFTCSECGVVNKARKRNIIIHLYAKQPLYNTVEFHCEACESCMVLFGMWEYIDNVDMSYWVIEFNEYAPDNVVEAYANIYFKPTLPPQDEDCITYFTRILSDTLTIDDIDWS